jgi:hypothetical protein
MRRTRLPAPLSALPLAFLLAAGCRAGSAKPAADSARAASAADSGALPRDAAAAADAPPPARGELPVVRALYVNRFAAQSKAKMKHLVGIADSTEINALVIDMKDEFGLNYNSPTPAFARNAGGMTKVSDVKALLDTLRAHKILPIARIVVFKDSVTARVNPQWTIRKTDDSIWRDHKGLAWVNPYHRELWDYNIGVAEELVKMGFGEVQFDYIRFPEPYKSLPQQVFPDNKGQPKPDAIAEFLKTANARLDKLGVHTTADIFGLVTTVKGPLEVAQEWEKLSPVTDVLLPMTYPSHYPPGSFGIARPNAEPYRIMYTAISKAHQRDRKLGIGGEHVRPWIQAFTLGKPPYGPQEITEQKRGIYDAGYDGWVLWNPGSKYDVFLPAFEKTLVSRKKPLEGAAPNATAARPDSSAPKR